MRLLYFTFLHPLPQRDIAGFRAAFAQAAGFEHEVFHNHRQEDGKLHYRYPLVQYRSDHKQAGIIGIDEGADAILQWYSNSNGDFVHNGVTHQLKLEKIDVRNYEIQYHAAPQKYILRQWLPLNQQRYQAWKNLEIIGEKMQELERILAANTLTFCRAVNWRLPQKFNVHILEISKTYKTGLLGAPHIAFDLIFSSDLQIPAGIGFGKAVSHGFGVCNPFRPPAPKPPMPEALAIQGEESP